MKKYFRIIPALFITLIVMSFTIAGNGGAFHGKLKLPNNCYLPADYSACSGSPSTLPANNGQNPAPVTLCTMSTGVFHSPLPAAPDFNTAECPGGVANVCCFKISVNSFCPSCTEVVEVYYRK